MGYSNKFFSLTTLLLLLLLGACKGKSSSVEISCGGTMNFACPADMYCNMTEACGGIDRNGICKLRPTQCKTDTQPVCGCDGETYSNACLAAAKGVSQKSIGACAPPPTPTPDDDEETDEQLEEELDADMRGE